MLHKCYNTDVDIPSVSEEINHKYEYNRNILKINRMKDNARTKNMLSVVEQLHQVMSDMVVVHKK